MRLTELFEALATAFDGPKPLERVAQAALRETAPMANYDGPSTPLPHSVRRVMEAPNAHPACAVLLGLNLPWAPTTTSSQPEYVEHSKPKVHVELLGPDGLVRSDKVRLGVYGMRPGHEYGLRTHPAEEVFVMLAGLADWMVGADGAYVALGPGERSHHPSMMPHASRTRDHAFMSVYAWVGDLSTEDYHYRGLPGTPGAGSEK